MVETIDNALTEFLYIAFTQPQVQVCLNSLVSFQECMHEGSLLPTLVLSLIKLWLLTIAVIADVGSHLVLWCSMFCLLYGREAVPLGYTAGQSSWQ